MTVELELRNFVQKSGKRPIVIRVTVNKKVTRKNTGYAVLEKDWDDAKKQVKRSHPNYAELNSMLRTEINKIEKAALNLHVKGGASDSSTIMAVAFAKHSLVDIAEERRKSFKKNGQYGSAKKAGTLVGLLKEFSPDITVQELDANYVERFKQWRKDQNKSHNTIVTNLSAIRALYNEAIIKIRYRPDVHPFDEAEVGTFKAADKKTLDEAEIEKLWDFEGSFEQNRARDVFLASFYLAGARFGDVLRIKWADISKGRVQITPTKTKDTTAKVLDMRIQPRLATIFSRYNRSSETVFNLVTTGDAYEIDSLNANLGKTFKLVLLGAGIAKNISYSCARHTFARIANKKSNRDVFSIKTALGHSRMNTTEIYLGHDIDAVDALMDLVYNVS